MRTSAIRLPLRQALRGGSGQAPAPLPTPSGLPEENRDDVRPPPTALPQPSRKSTGTMSPFHPAKNTGQVHKRTETGRERVPGSAREVSFRFPYGIPCGYDVLRDRGGRGEEAGL